MSAYSDRIIADGASNYWRLGETSGLTAVDVVGGKNGTLSGGVTLGAAGAIGDGDKAMTFDGTTGKIVTVASVPLPLLCTIEVWLKCPAATGAAQPIFDTRGTGSGDTLTLAVTPEGSGNLYSTTAGSTTAGPLVGSQWHHWIAVLSGATCQFYIDGQVDTVGATPQVRTVPSSGPAKIGVDQFSQYYAGALDEVAIYPRALTAPEIAAHYTLAIDAGLPAPPTWWLQDDEGLPMIPYNDWRPITPSDTVNLDGSTGVGRPTCDALYVGGAGIVRAVKQDGGTVDFTVVAGQILPMAAIRVNATGTTATGLVALHQV